MGGLVIPVEPWYWGDVVFPAAGRDTPFLMLRCYMDESGLGKNVQEVLCRNSLCMPLQEPWGLVLDEYGVDEFKSKSFLDCGARRRAGGRLQRLVV
jgi:hypothetical protein